VRILGILLIAAASVSLVAGGISIMNIMLVSVAERTREIGLRMAVGANGRNIRRQFLIEALIFALMGGLVGALLGVAAAVAIARKAVWPILISPWTIVLVCGFAGFVGISFGLYPSAWCALGQTRYRDVGSSRRRYNDPLQGRVRFRRHIYRRINFSIKRNEAAADSL
jgi:ABC-type lipoprotein release transport system permease subunit